MCIVLYLAGCFFNLHTYQVEDASYDVPLQLVHVCMYVCLCVLQTIGMHARVCAIKLTSAQNE